MVESIKELREICQPMYKKKTEMLYSVRYARKISIYFTKLLLYTDITGNQTTLLFILIGILAGIFFAHGNPFFALIGALLLQLWWIFDHVDGEVARYRGHTNVTGTYVDFMSHYIIHPYIFICISFGIYNTFHNVMIFGFGFSASLSVILIDAMKDCMYKAVVIARLHSHHPIKGKKDINLEPSVSPSRIRRLGRIINRVIIWRVYVRARPFVIVPRIIHIILLASLVDVVIPHFTIGSLMFNSLYVILFLHGVFAPFIWIWSAIYIIEWKSSDKMYRSLFTPRSE